jgi:hypothetical protein
VRNAYLLVNYGDFVDGATTTAPPYVQLLSVTDPTAAHLDFVNTRPGPATTTDAQLNSSDTPDVIPYRSHRQTRGIIIGSVIGGCVFLMSMVAIVYITWRRQRRRHFVLGPTSSSVDKRLSYDHTMYHPLQFAPSSGEPYPEQGHHMTSSHDPSDETTHHDEDHNNAQPRYEDHDS